ncbi:MAG: heparinase II/III family protein [Candidatus Latescibacteria bacterium]|nr:heparinase II/III family protein [Candidatus Latescibacterota bacterium]
MRFKWILVIFALLLIGVSVVYGDLTKVDIDKAINKAELRHPYLYFSDADKPALKERIKNDPESRDIMARLISEANRLLFTPVDRVIPIQGRNTRADWSEYDKDNKYEDYFYSNRNGAFTLAFVYQMTGEKKYAEKAFEFADAFCDLQSWTLRAHEFPIIYSRIMPWNVPDDQVNFNFDHVNGDSGRMYAAVYDWLYPALNEAQRDRIRGALLEKVVTRVRGDWEYHWWAVAYRCNWCGVCNSGVGLTGLALLTEDPQLTDIVAEAHNRIDSMLNELGVDGGWQEGGGYWNYGVHTSTFFADALKRLTKGKYDLFKNERLRSNPATFPLFISVAGGTALNFEDSGARRIGSSHLINKLASETGNTQAAWYRQEYFDAGDDIFDIIWPRPTIKAEPPKNPSLHFRTINWWVMRSDFKDPEKVLVAGKAGKNDDPHHGHLDIGHFVVYWKGQAYIQDIGSGSYDEKYFDDARFDYPQASSLGHNVVFVNGEKQLSGKLRKQPYNYDIGGEVLEFRSSDTRDYVIMDPANAYPKKEMKGWRRHVTLEKPIITVVVDEVKCDKGAEIEARFHSECSTDIRDNYVLLNGKDGKMALIPVVDGDFTFRPGRHACQPVNATRNFFWVPYFGTVVKAGGTNTIIGTVILPVDNDSEADSIAMSVKRSVDGSGNLSISFTKAGKTYRYSYKKGSEGLVLEK